MIVLAACIAAPFGMAIWTASHPPQSPGQRTASKNNKRTATKTIEERHEATEEAIATYTLWLMAFTGILAIATAGLGGLNFFQVRLARAEFISTHRPKLRIRRIFPITPFAANEAPRIRILAANIGDTKATVFEFGCEIYTDVNHLPGAIPAPIAALEVPPGKQISIEFTGGAVLDFATADAARDGWIFVVGIINYADDQGVVRSTAFARRYSSSRNRFIPVADDYPESDREYEDWT